MSDETKPVDQVIDDKPADEPKIEDQPEAIQKLIKDLRNEGASRRVANKTLEEQRNADAAELERLRAAEEKMKAEQGDFKSLYEDAKPKLEAAAKLETELSGYQEYFKSQLDAVLDGADESIIQLISTSTEPIQTRLDLARKLTNTKTQSTSPHSGRPGGGLRVDSDIVKQYQEAKTSAERSKLLVEAKALNPNVYKSLLNIKVA